MSVIPEEVPKDMEDALRHIEKYAEDTLPGLTGLVCFLFREEYGVNKLAYVNTKSRADIVRFLREFLNKLEKEN